MEIVPRTVKVDRHQEDRVVSVLLAVRLGLHQEHLFGQPVRCIGFLGVAVPQVLLHERDWSELGIRADGAQRYEFFNPTQPRFMHQLHSHHQVVVKEFCRVFAVGTDPTDLRSEVNNDVRFTVIQHVTDGASLDKIIFLNGRNEHLCRTAFVQFGGYK